MPFIGQQPVTGAYHKLDSITTSATATYNLLLNGGAYSPASANHLLVSLNGVIQAPQDSFTVSGSQITFASALTSSDNIDFIMAFGDVLSVGVPTDGSVNTSQLANSAVTDAKIASGITSSKLTGALPAIDGSALTNLPAGGITHYSRWSRSDAYTLLSSGDNYFTTNWNSYGDTLGTNMSESGGVFTFPETGFWLIRLLHMGYANAGAVVQIRGDIETSSNGGSSYANRAYAPQGKSSARWYSATQEFVIDVNNVSNWRARMKTYDPVGGAEVYFNSGFHTSLIFMRLGDT